MKHSAKKNKRQGGFSLLELLLVVGVGAILLLAGLAVYRMVTTDNAVNETIRVIFAVKSGVQRMYEGRLASYPVAPTSMLPALINAEIFPDTVRVDPAGPGAIHPIGRSMDVVGDSAFFDIVINDVSSGDCIKMGTVFTANSETEDDFESLSVDAGAGVTLFDIGNPIDPAALTVACQNGGVPVNNVDLIFKFR